MPRTSKTRHAQTHGSGRVGGDTQPPRRYGAPPEKEPTYDPYFGSELRMVGNRIPSILLEEMDLLVERLAAAGYPVSRTELICAVLDLHMPTSDEEGIDVVARWRQMRSIGPPR